MDSAGAGKAALAAIETVIWQLVRNGAIPSAPLAAELERYASFGADTAGPLRALARVARAAAFPDDGDETPHRRAARPSRRTHAAKLISSPRREGSKTGCIP
jgi:hypothetical protein